jgi:GntR family transcriptional regulator
LRHVLAALQEVGLVRRQQGWGGGTFVSHAKVEHELTNVVGMPAYLARQGYSAGSRVLSARMGAPDTATAHALQLGVDALIVDLQRLRLADGMPFSLDHACFTADLFPGLLELPLGGSMYKLFAEEFGITPSEASERVDVVHCDG